MVAVSAAALSAVRVEPEQAGRSVLALVDELLQHRLVQPLEG